MPEDDHSKHFHLTRGQLVSLAGAVLAVISTGIGTYAWIDGEFDALRADMVKEFEASAKAHATASGDLNYRLGFHTALEQCRERVP